MLRIRGHHRLHSLGAALRATSGARADDRLDRAGRRAPALGRARRTGIRCGGTQLRRHLPRSAKTSRRSASSIGGARLAGGAQLNEQAGLLASGPGQAGELPRIGRLESRSPVTHRAFPHGDGRLGAIEDQCAHRRMKLSLGKVQTAGWSARITAGLTIATGEGESPSAPRMHACVRATTAPRRAGVIWVKARGSSTDLPALDDGRLGFRRRGFQQSARAAGTGDRQLQRGRTHRRPRIRISASIARRRARRSWSLEAGGRFRHRPQSRPRQDAAARHPPSVARPARRSLSFGLHLPLRSAAFVGHAFLDRPANRPRAHAQVSRLSLLRPRRRRGYDDRDFWLSEDPLAAVPWHLGPQMGWLFRRQVSAKPWRKTPSSWKTSPTNRRASKA